MIKDLLVALDESKTCVVIPENGKEPLLMQKRQISVYISLLKNHAKKFGIEKDVAFVAKRFKEYETLLGDHIDNLEYLAQSQKELAKPIKGMTVKLYEIMLKI